VRIKLGTLLSVGLADGKSVSREWNFDQDGRKSGKTQSEATGFPRSQVVSEANKVTSSNGE